jgi:hypothetical protein
MPPIFYFMPDGTHTCAVRHNFRKTKNSAVILEKRRAVVPPGLALQALEMVLQATIDFLKIDRIEVTFLKIARIFLNQSVPRRDLVRNSCERTNMPLNHNLEKSVLKLEKRRESALILENGFSRKCISMLLIHEM